jgi:hypothetical protein
VNLPYNLFDTGDLKFPHPSLSPGNQQAQDAYLKQIKGLLTSGIGWFRNSFDHLPHNLPTFDEAETLEHTIRRELHASPHRSLRVISVGFASLDYRGGLQFPFASKLPDSGNPHMRGGRPGPSRPARPDPASANLRCRAALPARWPHCEDRHHP